MKPIEQQEIILQQPTQYLYFEDNYLINFDIICDELSKQFNCTYVSYALEMSNGKRIHYYSNRSWQEAFVKEGLIEHCPLLKFAREANASMLSWNSLAGFLSKKQRYVMEARKSFDIGNGIGTKNSVYGMIEFSTFASTIENNEFARIFTQNIKHFRKYVSQLRILAIASMLISGWLHPSKINLNLKEMITDEATDSISLH